MDVYDLYATTRAFSTRFDAPAIGDHVRGPGIAFVSKCRADGRDHPSRIRICTEAAKVQMVSKIHSQHFQISDATMRLLHTMYIPFSAQSEMLVIPFALNLMIAVDTSKQGGRVPRRQS
jgi:hypothetical protein